MVECVHIFRVRLPDYIESDTSAIGMTGQVGGLADETIPDWNGFFYRIKYNAQVTHDAIMLCGGKSGATNIKKCQTYEPLSNTWLKNTTSMHHKRHRAASVLDEDGNMWVLGGIDGSDSADSTEVFDFASRRWTRGYPMPSELRDSGLSSHCAVRCVCGCVNFTISTITMVLLSPPFPLCLV